MAMTQRDFEAMAEAMVEAKQEIVTAYEKSGASNYIPHYALRPLETATRKLADACARQYKGAYSFNRDRFYEACGFPELRSN